MGELVAEAHAKTEHIGFWSGKTSCSPLMTPQWYLYAAKSGIMPSETETPFSLMSFLTLRLK